MLLDKIKEFVKKLTTHSKYISNTSPNTIDVSRAIVVTNFISPFVICLN